MQQHNYTPLITLMSNSFLTHKEVFSLWGSMKSTITVVFAANKELHITNRTQYMR